MLIGIRIRNYDAFDDDKCGLVMEDYLTDCGPALSSDDSKDSANKSNSFPLLNLSALIGRNSTGKTTFLDALSFVRKTVTSDVAVASTLEDRPGIVNLLIDKNRPAVFNLFFNIKPSGTSRDYLVEYDLEISTNIHGSPFISHEAVSLCLRDESKYSSMTILAFENGRGKVLIGDSYQQIDPTNEMYSEEEICDKHSCALKTFGSIRSYTILHGLYREISRWFFCKFSNERTSTYFVDGNAPGGHRHLNSSGSNVMNVLNYIRVEDESRYEKIVDEINEKIPSMKHKRNLPSSLEESPNRLFLFMLLLRDQDPHSTIFMETPDKDLYHDMVDVLSSEMRDFTINNAYSQIVFTTHNPYIIETMSPREVWVFKRKFEKSVGDIEIKCAASDEVVEAMFNQGVGMGAIWYGGHLDEETNQD